MACVVIPNPRISGNTVFIHSSIAARLVHPNDCGGLAYTGNLRRAEFASKIG